MANPFIVAAVTAYPVVSNLQSLANNQAKGLGVVGTTLIQYVNDIFAPLVIRTSGITSGRIERYLVCSEDNTTFDYQVNPTANADQSAALQYATPIDFINVNFAVATTVTFKEISVWSTLGFMPSYWAWVIWNKSNQPLDATLANFTANHSLISFA